MHRGADHIWLDAVSNALCMSPPLTPGPAAPSPLRPYARAYAYRGLRAFASLSMARSEGGKRKRKARAEIPLWPWSRTTAFRRVKEAMHAAGIADGPHKCPKGLRHGYGVHAIGCGVPLNMLSKWMGHASLEVTAIYANALGEEQHSIAARMWE